MSKSHRSPGPIPKRWLHCPRKASDLIIGKFLAFKTPLDEKFDDQVPPECRFHPKMLFDSCKAKKVKLGLWIDLTNTSRFYNKAEVEEHGCKYLKVQCRGFGETPSHDQTEQFVHLVHNFIAQHPLECIAVHCTHGFNRSGFLIVSYLVQKMDCSLEIALEMFAKVRVPGIYKADYLQELFRRYDDVDDTPPPPQLPNWCFDEEEEDDNAGSFESVSNNSNTSQGESSEGSESSTSWKPSKRKNGKKAVFMAGIPGVFEFIDQPKAYQLQKKVQTMCRWKQKGFPGSQPVSMDNGNLILLQQKPYRVSWKADGTRYMMLIDGQDDVYFLDREHNIFKVRGLTFPQRKRLRGHLSNTLLDGEMVIDKFEGKDIPRYLAYDIVMFEGIDIGKEPFYPTRTNYLEYEIIRPRHVAMEQGIINKADEPFSVRIKQFWDLTQASSLLGEKFAATLSHEPDGLIFQPSKEPYTPGRCDDVLKWKPLSMNSVDFKLKIVKQEGAGIIAKKVGYLFVGQLDKPFDSMKYTKDLKELDGKIIECTFENNQWKFMRERIDKSFPNSYNTAQAVCGSIRNPITKEKLLDYIEKYRFADDSEMMPPPSKKIRR